MSNANLNIPVELIVEILIRLPVKSLLRFKSVHKSWYALITSPNFINLQFRYASSIEDNHRLILKHCIDNTSISASPSSSPIHVSFVSDNKQHLDLSTHVPIPISLFDDNNVVDDFVTFYGPCNGIICARGDKQGDHLSLWSPSTRQLKRLPLISGKRKVHPRLSKKLNLKVMSVEIGFGFDFKTNDYKVVRILNFDDALILFDLNPYVEVYNLSTNRWRKLDVVVPLRQRFKEILSTYINGVYYWSSSVSRRPRLILSFDFATEAFDVIEMSPDMGGKLIRTVLKYKESLAIGLLDDIDSFPRSIALWVLTRDDTGKNTWSKLFKVPSAMHLVLGFLKNDNALICNIYCGKGQETVGSYDPSSQQIKNMVAYDNTIYNSARLQVVNYVESLVHF